MSDHPKNWMGVVTILAALLTLAIAATIGLNLWKISDEDRPKDVKAAVLDKLSSVEAEVFNLKAEVAELKVEVTKLKRGEHD